jgi:hypothetical protein
MDNAQCSRTCSNLGFTRELEVERDHLMADPSLGGSRGYPVWYRLDVLDYLVRGTTLRRCCCRPVQAMQKDNTSLDESCFSKFQRSLVRPPHIAWYTRIGYRGCDWSTILATFAIWLPRYSMPTTRASCRTFWGVSNGRRRMAPRLSISQLPVEGH